jgi:hypothetical protein
MPLGAVILRLTQDPEKIGARNWIPRRGAE